MTTMDFLWYKDAIIYQVYVPAFFDTDGDGIGDVAGVLQKLDYISTLGASAFWLVGLSPKVLDGGDAGELRRLVTAAHRRGLPVIVSPSRPREVQAAVGETELLDIAMAGVRTWLDCGADGIDIDLSPWLREGPGPSSLSVHSIVKELRRFLESAYPGRVLLSEVKRRPDEAARYFGNGDECHLTFNIGLCARLLLALHTEKRRWLVDFIRQDPRIPPQCQWALFLRNHNELGFTACTDFEREQIRRGYAADPRMWVHGGVRRRLAPLLDNDRRRIELAYGLLFSLPGTPVMYYGNEIGMGDNIYIGDRSGIRTPMQWSSDRNAGFSRADPGRLYAAAAAPVNSDPVYGYHAINVESQERQPYSLLNWMRRLVRVRNMHRAFGRGTIEFIETRNQKILAYVRNYEDERIVVAANLAGTAQSGQLRLTRFAGMQPVELVGGTPFRRLGAASYALSFAPYGFYWFEFRRRAVRDLPPLYFDRAGTPATGGLPAVAADELES